MYASNPITDGHIQFVCLVLVRHTLEVVSWIWWSTGLCLPSTISSKSSGMLLGGMKEGNVFFNDALNTFYLPLYGVRHVVKDHSDSERGNPLSPHGLFFLLTAMILLYAPSHRQDNTYHGLCYTSRGALAGMRNTFWVGHPLCCLRCGRPHQCVW